MGAADASPEDRTGFLLVANQLTSRAAETATALHGACSVPGVTCSSAWVRGRVGGCVGRRVSICQCEVIVAEWCGCVTMTWSAARVPYPALTSSSASSRAVTNLARFILEALAAWLGPGPLKGVIASARTWRWLGAYAFVCVK